MIITQDERHIESSDFQTTQFTMRADGKAFKILVSNLYSDKVRALIAEISVNSLDAHIAAGCPEKPIKVTFPTHYDPNFIVQDEGTGIPHDQVMRNYCVVFQSSKDKSNAFSGAKGIGRICALAVSDSYMITSVVDSEKRSYTVFYNSEGIPEIAMLGDMEYTDEPNGFTVTVPVKSEYINEFEKKAAQIYKYYPVTPIFTNSDLAIQKDAYLLESKDKKWGILGQSGTSKAVSGTYAYPINSSSIPDLTPAHAALLGSGIVLYFNIGQVNSAASREQLDYDKATIKNIRAALDQAQAELTEIIKEKLQGSNLFEKIKMAGDLLSYNGSLSAISNLSRAVLDKSDCPLEYDFSEWDCLIIRKKGYNKMPVVNALTTIAPGASLIFFYGGKKTSYAKLRGYKYLETNPHHNIIVLTAGTKTEQEFEDFYGVKMDSFPKFSDLPFNKPNTIKSRKEAGEFNVFQAGAYYAKEIWKKQKVDDDKEIYYVDRYAYTSYGDRKRLESETKSLSTLGCNDFVVVGLSDGEINKLEESNDLDIKPFTDYYAAVIKEKREENKEILVENYYYQTNYLSFPTSILDKLDINESSLLAKIHKEFKTLNARIAKNSRITGILGLMKGNTDYKYSTELLKGHYPLLKCIDTYSLGKEASKDLSDYINSKNIDSLAEKE